MKRFILLALTLAILPWQGLISHPDKCSWKGCYFSMESLTCVCPPDDCGERKRRPVPWDGKRARFVLPPMGEM